MCDFEGSKPIGGITKMSFYNVDEFDSIRSMTEDWDIIEGYAYHIVKFDPPLNSNNENKSD